MDTELQDFTEEERQEIVQVGLQDALAQALMDSWIAKNEDIAVNIFATA